MRTPELKDKHREVYRQAMGCADPLQMRVAATAFESVGMTGCAAALRDRAAAIDAAVHQMELSLSEETEAQLHAICDATDKSEAEVVALLIAEAHRIIVSTEDSADRIDAVLDQARENIHDYRQSRLASSSPPPAGPPPAGPPPAGPPPRTDS